MSAFGSWTDDETRIAERDRRENTPALREGVGCGGTGVAGEGARFFLLDAPRLVDR
jgi:hypothetical protein